MTAKPDILQTTKLRDRPTRLELANAIVARINILKGLLHTYKKRKGQKRLVFCCVKNVVEAYHCLISPLTQSCKYVYMQQCIN